MLVLLILAAWAIIKLAPRSAAGRFLNRMLVTTPARVLSRFSATSLILAALMIAAAGAMLLYGGDDARFITAQGLPEGLAWIAAFDLGSWIDLIVVGWALGASVRLRAVREGVLILRRRLRAPRRAAPARPRDRAVRSRRSPPAADNEDEPPPALARAA